MAIKSYTSLYDANETMRILGQQCSCKYIGGGAVGYNDFKAVIEAHKAAADTDNDLFSIGVDFFMLSFIYGKRAERADKQRKELQPLTVAEPIKEMTVEQIAAELTEKPYLLDFMRKVKESNPTPEQLRYLTAFCAEMARRYGTQPAQ